jgi:hypothetical protein
MIVTIQAQTIVIVNFVIKILVKTTVPMQIRLKFIKIQITLIKITL